MRALSTRACVSLALNPVLSLRAPRVLRVACARADFEASKGRQAKSTVGQRFLSDVSSLLGELGSIRPFFIRCIKPNKEKVAKVFTVPLVLEQLRCSGLMGAVKLMQEAYPTRIPYDASSETD